MVVFVLLLLFFRFIRNLCFFILSIGQVHQFLNNQIHFQRWMLLNTFLQFSVNFFFLYYVSIFGSLNYIIFRDSKIAKKFKCARTKTSSVLNEAITPNLRMYLVDQLSKEPYALVNDRWSDSGVKKMNAVCALIFYVRRFKEVEFRIYICSTSGDSFSTEKTLFESINP